MKKHKYIHNLHCPMCFDKSVKSSLKRDKKVVDAPPIIFMGSSRSTITKLYEKLERVRR